MANPEHLAKLKEGVGTWNKWRADKTLLLPIDLSEANLSRANLSGTNLSGANLSGANLSGANLSGANLSKANLSRANLFDADLSIANLFDADLSRANLSKANLSIANLIEADLSIAILSKANLSRANLSRANLSGTNLNRADLRGANLIEADLSRAILSYTLLADLDLSQVHGLETVTHRGPSSIGIDTIYKSGGNIPEVFLRGCGVSDDFITYMKSLVGNPIEYHSCFISYSSKDDRLAQRIYADLQARGVRCWFAPHDLPIGAKTREEIDRAIEQKEKLLLILSKNSVQSDWVEKEVETAMEKERKQKRLVLFPIRMDDAVSKVVLGWAADIRRSRNIGDFKRWKHDDDYKQSFERLLRDLKAVDQPA